MDEWGDLPKVLVVFWRTEAIGVAVALACFAACVFAVFR
jgi:hypothetical protein